MQTMHDRQCLVKQLIISEPTIPDEQTEENIGTPQTFKAPPSLIRKFLLTWLSFVLVLVGLALIVDIDWAKPYCQRALAQMFHRQVLVGHLTWSFGLNGLEIDTTRLTVLDHNGQPFLAAGNSEIGIAILPLLHKKTVINHLDFDRPEIWAIRTGKTAWNFDDLLAFGQDIRYFQLRHGKVHIIDRIPGACAQWSNVDLNEAKLNFVWPRKGRPTPFYFAFKLPKKGYTTSFDLSGLGSGALANWRDNNYKFKATVQQANPDDVMPFLRAISDRPLSATTNGTKFEQLEGLFDFKLDAKGVLSKGITADVSAEAHKLSFDAPVLGMVKTPEASGQAKITIDTKKLEWTDMITRFSNIELKSRGSLSDWSRRDGAYSAKVDGDINDLSNVSKLVEEGGKNSSNRYVDPKKLTGTAQVQIRIVGSSAQSKLTSDMKTKGVSVEDFIATLPKQLQPVLCVLGINKNSTVQGEIQLVPDDHIDIKKGVIPVAGGSIVTEGSANLKTDQAKFHFHSQGLPLAQADDNLYRSPVAMSELAKMIYLTPKKKLVLAGTVDIDGIFENLAAGRHDTNGTAQFNNAQFCLSDGSLAAKNMHGLVKWNNERLMIEHLNGTIGDGTFTLSGTASVKGDASVNLKIHSTHLALSQLNTVLKVLKVKIPLLTEHALLGRVHDLSLNLTGPRSSPTLYFSASPEDLCYQPAGMKRPLRATSGTVTYDHDVLTLQDVDFVTHNDKVTTSLSISDLSHKAVVGAIKVKSKGIDLSDVDFYLASPIMPRPLKSLYTNFLKEYKLEKVHGRVYGDALCQMKGDKPILDGVLSLINVGAKVGSQHFPVEHIAGVLAASGETLRLENVSGSIRNTHFDVDGQVAKYATSPSWKTDLRASIYPQELLELVPALTDQFKKWKLTIRASEPLVLKATVIGKPDKNDIEFGVSSLASNQLSIATVMGQLHQPAGESLNLDGSVSITPQAITVANTSLLLGDSHLHANGSINWAFKKDEVDLTHSDIQLSMKSSNAIPAIKLIAMLDPGSAKDVGGTVQGDLRLTGTIAHPKPNGKVQIARLSIPKFDVADLTGVIELEELAGADQKASIDFSNVQVGQFPIHKIKAEINLDADEEGVRQPKILIKKGRAQLAGGGNGIGRLVRSQRSQARHAHYAY